MTISPLLENAMRRHGITEPVFHFLESRVRQSHHARNEVVRRSGTPCDEIIVVLSGSLRTCIVNDSGNEITYSLFFENSLASDYSSYITNESSRFDLRAIEDSTVQHLRRSDLNQAMARFPELLPVVMDLINAAFVALDRRVESLLLESPAERYRAFLASFGDQAARIPQYILASYLGVAPESLSRLRQREGFIS